MEGNNNNEDKKEETITMCVSKDHLHYRNLYRATTYCPVHQIEWTWEIELRQHEFERLAMQNGRAEITFV